MLETQIDKKLWDSIKKNYESRSFSESIIDAIYFLSNLIRDKTGLESDGASLIGQAFGGTQPLIKVNAMQTESEINVQKGLEQILRGMYQAIRNPRSHDKFDDSQKEADAIITFIDYLCSVIDQSKTQFSEVEFLSRVFDSNFVPNIRYAELLVEEIPKRKRLNFAIEVYKKKETGDGKKLAFFFHVIVRQFNEEEITQFFTVVSDELTTVTEEKTIRFNLQIIPFDMWYRIREISRIRIENSLMESMRDGKYLENQDICKGGSLATWVAWGKLKHFTFIGEAIEILVKKLDSNDRTEIDYVLKYFWDDILENNKLPNYYFFSIVNQKLKDGDKRFYTKLEDLFKWDVEETEFYKAIQKEYNNFQEREESQVFDINDDDLPF
ncbi:TIGR02391 family protein [Paenibacillus odorifer]|uniref:TIGR02391 family protein n=1 Tax=Paenibacillus odorifer TaxID=189426 RepID=A0A1R0XMX4_9BACL|nr:TIGR02391 family protein [Paenibacillus odorifer]OMD36342.1 TIGR02391 family protein [Paenibacillus odorifer]